MAKSFINKCLIAVSLFTATVIYNLALGNQNILILGDSLSAAYGINPQEGWVAILQQKLAEEYPNYSVVNSSIDGNTTAEGLERLGELLKKYKPVIVLLELGANDGLRGTPIDTIRSNLQQMIEQCLQNNSQVILLGMKIPPNYGPQYTQQFSALYGDLSKKYKTALVDFLLAGVAENPAYKQSDMLHPNAAAQAKIFANVWPTLKPLLIH